MKDNTKTPVSFNTGEYAEASYNAKISKNMKGYRCSECGTGYTTTGNKAPPSPNWADGHKCTMVEVESKLNDGCKKCGAATFGNICGKCK